MAKPAGTLVIEEKFSDSWKNGTKGTVSTIVMPPAQGFSPYGGDVTQSQCQTARNTRERKKTSRQCKTCKEYGHQTGSKCLLYVPNAADQLM